MEISPLHIPLDQLADYVEGCLPAPQYSQVLDHLTRCPTCAREAAWLGRTIALMRSDQAEDAPPEVITRAIQLFEKQAQPVDWLAPMRRIVAVLTQAPSRPSLALGFRSGATDNRQLLYRADDYDLDVRLSGSAGRWTIAGQVLGPVTGGQIRLSSATGAIETTLNALAEFSFTNLLADHYQLILTTNTVEIEINNLEVGD